MTSMLLRGSILLCVFMSACTTTKFYTPMGARQAGLEDDVIVVMKDGRELQGSIVSADTMGVSLQEDGNGDVTVLMNTDIREIQKKKFSVAKTAGLVALITVSVLIIAVREDGFSFFPGPPML